LGGPANWAGLVRKDYPDNWAAAPRQVKDAGSAIRADPTSNGGVITMGSK